MLLSVRELGKPDEAPPDCSRTNEGANRSFGTQVQNQGMFIPGCAEHFLHPRVSE